MEEQQNITTKKQFKDNFFFHACIAVFKDPFYVIFGLSAVLNILFFYYFLFLKVTTLSVFFQSNVAVYYWLYIILTIISAFLFGMAFSFLIWQWRRQRTFNTVNTGHSLIGSLLGAASMGCPSCGAFLLSLFGIAGGLFIFPFQGLEIKIAALGLLAFSVLSSAKSISDNSKDSSQPHCRENIVKIEGKKIVFYLNKETVKPVLPVLFGLLVVVLVVFAPFAADKMNLGINFQKNKNNLRVVANSGTEDSSSAADVMNQINPPNGYTVNVSYGDIGPKLLSYGAINLEAMKALYKQAGSSLTDEELKILTQGSAEKIKISPENSHFLLNFFWAFGLTNKNPILDNGPMMQYGKGQVGNFASTGGWTLGTKDAIQLYSQYEIVKLTPAQQKVLEDFAYNSYRPCCSNPTGFPDCNHGMAALGFAELMASQGATAQEIFEAFKFFNSFWFPQNYFDIANYFKEKEGLSWSQVDARTIAGKDYSTPQGLDRVRTWLKSNNLLKEPPSSGGGCGV